MTENLQFFEAQRKARAVIRRQQYEQARIELEADRPINRSYSNCRAADHHVRQKPYATRTVQQQQQSHLDEAKNYRDPSLKFREHHSIRHRNVDNTPCDTVAKLLRQPEALTTSKYELAVGMSTTREQSAGTIHLTTATLCAKRKHYKV